MWQSNKRQIVSLIIRVIWGSLTSWGEGDEVFFSDSSASWSLKKGCRMGGADKQREASCWGWSTHTSARPFCGFKPLKRLILVILITSKFTNNFPTLRFIFAEHYTYWKHLKATTYCHLCAISVTGGVKKIRKNADDGIICNQHKMFHYVLTFFSTPALERSPHISISRDAIESLFPLH